MEPLLIIRRSGFSSNNGKEPFYVKGVTSADYNNDGWIDLYISTLHSQSEFGFYQ